MCGCVCVRCVSVCVRACVCVVRRVSMCACTYGGALAGVTCARAYVVRAWGMGGGRGWRLVCFSI